MSTEFTPVSATAGGLMIGAAAALLLLVNGRIAGVSGIFDGVLRRPGADWLWRAAFVAGLPLGAALYLRLGGDPTLRIEATTPEVLVAGFLVGLGTRIGSGCTSGHGVCGLARGSPRSMVATATFMLFGALTVWVVTTVKGAQ
jgi:uncharacterized membrane protein YedE/YeeE